METSNDQQIKAYWQSFIQHNPAAAGAGYQAWSFGSTPQIADQLSDLVRRGTKTATASLYWSYAAENEPDPAVGDINIILDGRGLPVCIIQTTAVSVVPFDAVDETQAYLEGEGDRSLAYWREVHWAFFADECRQIGKQPDAKMPVVCQRFILVFG